MMLFSSELEHPIWPGWMSFLANFPKYCALIIQNCIFINLIQKPFKWMDAFLMLMQCSYWRTEVMGVFLGNYL